MRDIRTLVHAKAERLPRDVDPDLPAGWRSVRRTIREISRGPERRSGTHASGQGGGPRTKLTEVMDGAEG